MSYNPNKHGRAEYGSYMQVPNNKNIPEGDDSVPLSAQRFARIVYNVAPMTLSGDVTVDVDTVGIDDSGNVKVSGDALKVFDQAVVDAINAKAFTVTPPSAMTVNLSGVGLSGNQLNVFDKQLIDEIILTRQQETIAFTQIIRDLNTAVIKDNYSRVIQERGNDIYIAHAPVGTSTATSGWRVQKINDTGDKLWAASGQFTNPANIELSGLTYNY